MRILFTAPRFHTNQVPIVKGLIEKGHEVRFFVAFEGAIEDHRYCQPLVLKPSRYTVREKKRLSKVMDESDVESAIGGRFVPDFAFLKAAFTSFMPDMVICREKTNLTACVYALCRQNHVSCILYDQEPLYPGKIEKDLNPSSQKRKSINEIIQTIMRRKLSPDMRQSVRFREKYGFPKQRITPVKYMVGYPPAHFGNHFGNGWYVPLVYTLPEEASPTPINPSEPVQLLCVAKYRPYKSLPVLLNAMNQTRDLSNWRLTVIGQMRTDDEISYYGEMAHEVQAMGLTDRIRLLKDVPYAEMPEVYAKHHLLILPSKKETFGMTVLEAMGYGLDVIVSDGCGVAFCAEEAGSSIFQAGNAKSLSDAIRARLIEPTQITLQGQKNTEYIRKQFSFSTYYDCLHAVIQNEM